MQSSSAENFPLAPAEPTTAYGQMLQYYLKMEPGLFRTAVEDQFARLKQERDEEEAHRESLSESESDSEALSLSSLEVRIGEVKVAERQATVEDLMYMCILEEFINLGVSMLTKMDNYTAIDSINLDPLMKGVHSAEAMDMVKQHLRSLLGQTAALPSTATLKMSKLQMVQVYAASAMFGYFIRKVDKRFQLAKSMNMLPEDKEDAVARLERLFSMASDDSDLDSAPPVTEGSDNARPSSESSTSTSGQSANSVTTDQPALRKYIESFDQAMMVQMASIMSKEGISILERQTSALWGDVKALQAQMQEVIGNDATSVEEIMKRAEAAVMEDKVDTVTMSVSTQRRAVLEAVAFGTFLRDTETYVDLEYGLLTKLPSMGSLPGH